MVIKMHLKILIKGFINGEELNKSVTSKSSYCSCVKAFFETTNVLSPSLAILPH